MQIRYCIDTLPADNEEAASIGMEERTSRGVTAAQHISDP